MVEGRWRGGWREVDVEEVEGGSGMDARHETDLFRKYHLLPWIRSLKKKLKPRTFLGSPIQKVRTGLGSEKAD
jgi:hypothetical protein